MVLPDGETPNVVGPAGSPGGSCASLAVDPDLDRVPGAGGDHRAVGRRRHRSGLAVDAADDGSLAGGHVPGGDLAGVVGGHHPSPVGGAGRVPDPAAGVELPDQLRARRQRAEQRPLGLQLGNQPVRLHGQQSRFADLGAGDRPRGGRQLPGLGDPGLLPGLVALPDGEDAGDDAEHQQHREDRDAPHGPAGGPAGAAGRCRRSACLAPRRAAPKRGRRPARRSADRTCRPADSPRTSACRSSAVPPDRRCAGSAGRRSTQGGSTGAGGPSRARPRPGRGAVGAGPCCAATSRSRC